MDCAGDQFLTSSGLAKDEHRRIAAGYGSCLRQRIFERRTLTNDLLEVEFSADLIFQIEFLLREFVLELGNFAIRTRILQDNGQMCGDLMKQFAISG